METTAGHLLDRDSITALLESEGEETEALLRRAAAVRNATIGEGVYLRGLIEYSNVCRKDCLYCGIRSSQKNVERYTLTERQVLEAARYAYVNNYGSVVLQGGENQSHDHIRTIEMLLTKIKHLSAGKLGITLSFGEQTYDTYQRWFGAGAHRYLLRVETSDPELYARIHPRDGIHSHADRLRAIEDLRTAGYQVGTGVMIGLPGQTIGQLADDLLFMRSADIDMCGMGPYIPGSGTPLAETAAGDPGFRTKEQRVALTLKMIAVLRLMMPDINIASTTALQTLDPGGRLKGIEAGANIIMPNITPGELRGNYLLYDNKPMLIDSEVIEERIVYGEWGDSRHFRERSE